MVRKKIRSGECRNIASVGCALPNSRGPALGRLWFDRIATKNSDCGANAEGGGGFQPGNKCAAGGSKRDSVSTASRLDPNNPDAYRPVSEQDMQKLLAGEPGGRFVSPALANRMEFEVVVQGPGSTEGTVRVGNGYFGADVPRESLQQLYSDLTGDFSYLKDAGKSGVPEVDAVVAGKAKMIGKGNDGVVFEVGDRIVKASSTIPYHPVGGPPHRTPEQAIAMAIHQAKTTDDIRAAGVPGVPAHEIHELGDKVFTVRDKFDIPEKFNQKQLQQIRDSVQALHDAGYVVGDRLQIGVDRDGNAVHYDISQARKTSDEMYKRDEMQEVANLWHDNGETWHDMPKEALRKAEMSRLIIARRIESGRPIPAIERKELHRAFQALNHHDHEAAWDLSGWMIDHGIDPETGKLEPSSGTAKAWFAKAAGDCGANAEGGGGFQPGNKCAAGGSKTGGSKPSGKTTGGSDRPKFGKYEAGIYREHKQAVTGLAKRMIGAAHGQVGPEELAGFRESLKDHPEREAVERIAEAAYRLAMDRWAEQEIAQYSSLDRAESKQHAEAMAGQLQAFSHKVPEEFLQAQQAAIRSVVGNMPPAHAAALRKSVSELTVAANSDEVASFLAIETLDSHNAAAGAYVPSTGKLVLDGVEEMQRVARKAGTTLQDANMLSSLEGLAVHEFAHAIDKQHGRVSNSFEWTDAWVTEISDKRRQDVPDRTPEGFGLSMYAATSKSEGWAEYVRYVHEEPEKAIRHFPKSWAVYRKTIQQDPEGDAGTAKSFGFSKKPEAQSDGKSKRRSPDSDAGRQRELFSGSVEIPDSPFPLDLWNRSVFTGDTAPSGLVRPSGKSEDHQDSDRLIAKYWFEKAKRSRPARGQRAFQFDDDCGANAQGGGGFQPGNTCAAGAKRESGKADSDSTPEDDLNRRLQQLYRDAEAIRARQREAQQAEHPEAIPHYGHWKTSLGRRHTSSPEKVAAAQQKASQIEKSIFRNEFESLHLIVDGQELHSLGGSESEVRLDHTIKGLLEEHGRRDTYTILTHNHPGGWKYEEDHPQHVGNSFSRPDLAVAVHYGIHEMRAVTPTHRYTMRLKPEQKGAGYWMDTVQPKVNSIYESVSSEFWDKINRGDITPEQASAQHWHEINTRLAAEMGWKYERTEHGMKGAEK